MRIIIKLGIIYGGVSTEHEVSVNSAKSILENLNKEKYEIFEIYINKNGEWLNKNKDKIINLFEYLKTMDVVFPILHGKYGEDGTIQGLFEILKIPYVGAGVGASANGMDKVYTKIIFEKAKIPQAKYAYIRYVGEGIVSAQNEDGRYKFITENFEEIEGNISKMVNLVMDKIQFPMFVKPSNSGSSVGIKKAYNIEELTTAIEYAAQFDNKILIEENINGREIECAVIGNSKPIATAIGEIIPADEFYSYEAKYQNEASITKVPIDIAKEKEEAIKYLAVKAYKALDCKGLARVDFFVEKDTEQVYINEINTMPGFTKISMYPKLCEYYGLSYSDLLDKLINLAMEGK